MDSAVKMDFFFVAFDFAINTVLANVIKRAGFRSGSLKRAGFRQPIPDNKTLRFLFWIFDIRFAINRHR
jgi:hypothetical protein